ncbi:MAG: polyprenyl diphosphate synthase [Candidatus Thermoplasmatota archaeon]|jgi:tritrans,polycis-undecaprenyl-diphosphate synthase [geranylgeranyl-diphosphate specific]|nr:polyprenyl diphosphate synthase [Candidatus Thermoplasmatota archaeon]
MTLSGKLGDFASEVYEKVMMEEIRKSSPPRHLGIITDGNRRYARSLGLESNKGHVLGKNKLEEVLDWSREIGIKIVTVYGFSTENFKRDKNEVSFLMELIEDALKGLMTDDRIFRNEIRVKVIGDMSSLPKSLVESARRIEEKTEKFDKFRLNLAVGYGGRAEIIEAVKKIVSEALEGKINVNDITEEKFRSYLYDSTMPDPDLILRTSGEERVSNFLLWQSAYSELYFSDVNWPELKKIDFLRAILSYQVRKRRYGS